LVWPTTKLIAALRCASARLEYGSLSGPSPAGNITKFNIEAIAKLENEALHGRTITEGASDAIVKFNGSVAFLAMVLRAYTFLHRELPFSLTTQDVPVNLARMNPIRS
jgi:hypothetical protein